jgi:peptidoglycan/xylan/chitin deacetylase (PgdA/CDA1 family)
MRSRLKTPLASMTFDDFPRSAWTAGGEILRRRNLVGTYYVAGAYCEQTVDELAYFTVADLQAVAAAGHEIGCHTFSHERAPKQGSATLIDDIERNAAFVEDVLGAPLATSFAYPYGDVSLRVKRLISARFAVGRGIVGGDNAGTIDLSEIRAVGLERQTWSPERVEAIIRRAARRRAWIVFFTHDVSEAPGPFGATPAMLNHALDVLQSEAVEVLPVRDCAQRALAG